MENLQNQKSNEELVAIPEKYMLTIREAVSTIYEGRPSFLQVL